MLIKVSATNWLSTAETLTGEIAAMLNACASQLPWASCSPSSAVLPVQENNGYFGKTAVDCAIVSQLEAAVVAHLARVKTWEADHHAEGWLWPCATRVIRPMQRSA